MRILRSTYKWVDGTNIGFDDWTSGSRGSHDCVIADVNWSKNRAWKTRPCTDTKYYMCEWIYKIPVDPGEYS